MHLIRYEAIKNPNNQAQKLLVFITVNEMINDSNNIAFQKY